MSTSPLSKLVMLYVKMNFNFMCMWDVLPTLVSRMRGGSTLLIPQEIFPTLSIVAISSFAQCRDFKVPQTWPT